MSKTIITGGKIFKATSEAFIPARSDTLFPSSEIVLLFLETKEPNTQPPEMGYSLQFIGSIEDLKSKYVPSTIRDCIDGLVELKSGNHLGRGGFPMFILKLYSEAKEATPAELSKIGFSAYSWTGEASSVISHEGALPVNRFSSVEHAYRITSVESIHLMIKQSLCVSRCRPDAHHRVSIPWKVSDLVMTKAESMFSSNSEAIQ